MHTDNDNQRLTTGSILILFSGGDLDFNCELDECALLIRDLKASGIIRDHRKGLLSTHKNSFKGSEFIDWIVKAKQVGKVLHIMPSNISNCLSDYLDSRNDFCLMSYLTCGAVKRVKGLCPIFM